MIFNFRDMAIVVIGIGGFLLSLFQNNIVLGLIVLLLSLIALELQDINKKLLSKNNNVEKDESTVTEPKDFHLGSKH